jgi:hypothetical protein
VPPRREGRNEENGGRREEDSGDREESMVIGENEIEIDTGWDR